MTSSELLKDIYDLNKAFKTTDISNLIETVFNDWHTQNNWHEFNNFYYAADLNNISKTVALIMLTKAHHYKDNISMFTKFVDYCIDYFSDKTAFGKFYKEPPKYFGGW